MNVIKMGLAIKTLRTRAGLTQRQLSEKLGVTDKAVSKWERGLGAPDISTVNSLADVLNIDTDNLLAGNIAYLENEWVGMLRLDGFEGKISATTEIYGKPSVYFCFCYFALAGIREVYLSHAQQGQAEMRKLFKKYEEFGFKVHYSETKTVKKIMVVSGPVFVYGPNLTKYFQRGMSHNSAITKLVIPHTGINSIFLDGKHQASDVSSNRSGFKTIPISFINGDDQKCEYEPMAKGMMALDLKTVDDVVAASSLMQIANRYSGMQTYRLEEIAYRRGLIDDDCLKEIACGDEYLMRLIGKR